MSILSKYSKTRNYIYMDPAHFAALTVVQSLNASGVNATLLAIAGVAAERNIKFGDHPKLLQDVYSLKLSNESPSLLELWTQYRFHVKGPLAIVNFSEPGFNFAY